jgi:DNA gyrase subunit A
MRVDALKTRGRATQGVKLINIKNNDAIASVAVVPVEEEEEENAEEGVVNGDSTEVDNINNDGQVDNGDDNGDDSGDDNGTSIE